MRSASEAGEDDLRSAPGSLAGRSATAKAAVEDVDQRPVSARLTHHPTLAATSRSVAGTEGRWSSSYWQQLRGEGTTWDSTTSPEPRLIVFCADDRGLSMFPAAPPDLADWAALAASPPVGLVADIENVMAKAGLLH